MRTLLLFSLLALVACDAAGPGFRGVDKIEREVEGSRFTLRIQGNVVEAIRTNPEMLPRFDAVARKAGIAAQIETGCRADWVEGDPSMMLIGMACEGQKAPKRPKRSRMLYCDILTLQGRDGIYSGDMECGKY